MLDEEDDFWSVPPGSVAAYMDNQSSGPSPDKSPRTWYYTENFASTGSWSAPRFLHHYDLQRTGIDTCAGGGIRYLCEWKEAKDRVNKPFCIGVAAAVVGLMSLIGAPAAVSRAQDGPALVLTPDSGPCDATIQVSGSGFPPDSAITFSLNRPHSEGSFASIGSTVSDAGGAFAADVTLGEVGCLVASRDDDFDDPGEPKELGVTAHVDAAPSVGRGARYTYTTVSIAGGVFTATAEPPASTGMPMQDLQFAVSPTSGPCDATISATGSGFPARSEILISLSRPASEGSIVNLTSTVTDSSGAFSVLVTLGEFGCVVARITDEFVDPGGPKELGIAASTNPPGGGIRVVRYGYTTTSLAGEVEATSTPSAIGTAQPSATPSSSPTGSGDTGGIDWTDVAIPLGSAMAGAALTALFMMWRRRA